MNEMQTPVVAVPAAQPVALTNNITPEVPANPLDELASAIETFRLNSAGITIIDDSRYNLDLMFEYKGQFFMWWGVANGNETDIYLLKSCNVDCFAPRSGLSQDSTSDIDNYYCSPVFPETSSEDFIQILNRLIDEYREKEC